MDALIARGCTVVALDNFITGSKENVAHLADEPRFTLVEADVSDGLPTHHPAMAERFDAILHMASPASPTDFATLPIEILRVGSVATLHLLDRAVADGARFLMASTSEAYGDPQVHPQPEKLLGQRQPDRHPQRLRRGEALLRGGHDGLPPEPGARHRDRADLQHLRAADAPGRRPGHPDLHLAGAARRADHGARHRRPDRSICYIDDLVRGILLLLDSTEVGPINCGTEHEMSMRELAETIVRLAGSAPR